MANISAAEWLPVNGSSPLSHFPCHRESYQHFHFTKSIKRDISFKQESVILPLTNRPTLWPFGGITMNFHYVYEYLCISL